MVTIVKWPVDGLVEGDIVDVVIGAGASSIKVATGDATTGNIKCDRVIPVGVIIRITIHNNGVVKYRGTTTSVDVSGSFNLDTIIEGDSEYGYYGITVVNAYAHQVLNERGVKPFPQIAHKVAYKGKTYLIPTTNGFSGITLTAQDALNCGLIADVPDTFTRTGDVISTMIDGTKLKLLVGSIDMSALPTLVPTTDEFFHKFRNLFYASGNSDFTDCVGPMYLNATRVGSVVYNTVYVNGAVIRKSTTNVASTPTAAAVNSETSLGNLETMLGNATTFSFSLKGYHAFEVIYPTVE